MFKGHIYLDWASAAPVSHVAQKAFVSALSVFGNPSSPHAEGSQARTLLETSRTTIARLAGVKPESVIFTSGATEANAFAIRGHVYALRAAGRKMQNMHLLYLPTAHASVIETMQALATEGVHIEALALQDGAIDLQHLQKQVTPDTVLVSLDLVCGETGTRYHSRDVRRVLDAVRAKNMESELESTRRVVLHVDASQAPFVESYEHTHLGADLITLDAQKVGGVRGIGALIRPRASTLLQPLVQGGGQEGGLRPGTESPALAAAFATALTEAAEGRESFIRRATDMRAALLAAIERTIPSAVVNVGKEFAPHIVNLSFPGIDTDYVVMLLSERGFAVSTKSACETEALGSRTVLVLTGDEDRARATLRISWGPTTTPADLERFSKALAEVVAFVSAHRIDTDQL